MINSKYFGFDANLTEREFADQFDKMIENAGYNPHDITAPGCKDVNFYLELMNKIITENEEFSGLKKGDIVAPNFGYYRDELTLVYDCEKAILPDYEPDDYGSMPFTVVSPTDISFTDTLCHNSITWFAISKYLPNTDTFDDMIEDQYTMFGKFQIAEGDNDAGQSVIIVLGYGKNEDETVEKFIKLEDAKYVQVERLEEDLFEYMYKFAPTSYCSQNTNPEQEIKWSQFHKAIEKLKEVCAGYDHVLMPYFEDTSIKN